MRAQVEKKMAQKEKEKKEEKLRELAKMARDRRAGIKAHGDKGTRHHLMSMNYTYTCYHTWHMWYFPEILDICLTISV